MNGMRPIHPGEILREEFMEPHSLSANALAITLRVPASRINDISLERLGQSHPIRRCGWRATSQHLG